MPALSQLPLPVELIHEVIRHLCASSDCPTCLQTDLSSICASSRLLNAIATPCLYAAPVLVSSHNADDESPSPYEQHLHALRKTVASAPALGALVQHLQFAHEEPATALLWKDVVSATPQLRTVSGVETYFPEDEGSSDAAAAAFAALSGLSRLRTAVLHDETLSDRSLASLFNAWSSLETLALGSIIADGSSYADLAALSSTRLKHLYLTDFDLDYTRPAERADALAGLPPLETLSIDYTSGFTLDGVARFLSRSARHAAGLRTLEFRRQMRQDNPLSDLSAVLAAAPALRRLDVALAVYAKDGHHALDDDLPLLRSAELRELSYATIYAAADLAAADSSAAPAVERLLIASLPSLPQLQTLRVGTAIKTREDAPRAHPWTALRDEADSDASVLTTDPAALGRNGKRVLLVLDDDVKLEMPAQRISELKRGLGRGAVVCAVSGEEEQEAGAGAGAEAAAEAEEAAEAKECAGAQ